MRGLGGGKVEGVNKGTMMKTLPGYRSEIHLHVPA